MSVSGSSAYQSTGSPSDRGNPNCHENIQPVHSTSSIYGKSLDSSTIRMPAAETMVAPPNDNLPVQPRTMGSVDIAAFAAQAAQAAHADHAAAILRRKQAAVIAASVTPRRGAQQTKESIRRAPSSEDPGSTTTLAPSNPSAIVAGAAYCLIPQPYHHNGHNKRQNTEGSGCSDNVVCDAGGVAALRVGGESSPSPLTSSQPAPGSGGGGADGGFGGGAQAKSTKVGAVKRKARVLDEEGDTTAGGSSASMSAECRLERSREQNRQSSRKARLRRKSEEMSLKEQIQGIQVQLTLD